MAATALAQHYIAYLSSPATLLTLALVVAPISFTLLTDWIATNKRKSGARVSEIPGCRRIGLRWRSNLNDQHGDHTCQPGDTPRVEALFTYPIKSCRGVELGLSQIEPLGLSYDRLFTFARRSPKRRKGSKGKSSADILEDWESKPWEFITEREFPRLALLETQLWVAEQQTARPSMPGKKRKPNGHASNLAELERSKTQTGSSRGKFATGVTTSKKVPTQEGYFADNGGCLVVRFPHSTSFNPLGLFTQNIVIQIPLRPTLERAKAKQYTEEAVRIWDDNPKGINMTNEIDVEKLAKLKLFLGISEPLALFRRDDRHLRPITTNLPSGASAHEFAVGFSDAYPVNLVGLSSIRDVDANLPVAASAKGKLDARRFRANIYLSNTPAYVEDTWKRITLGRRLGRDQQGLFETEAEYHIACRTSRCTLPNVDPATGIRDRNEPYTTLSKTRKVDEGTKPHPCLGMQMIPLFQRGIVRPTLEGRPSQIVVRSTHPEPADAAAELPTVFLDIIKRAREIDAGHRPAGYKVAAFPTDCWIFGLSPPAGEAHAKTGKSTGMCQAAAVRSYNLYHMVKLCDPWFRICEDCVMRIRQLLLRCSKSRRSNTSRAVSYTGTPALIAHAIVTTFRCTSRAVHPINRFSFIIRLVPRQEHARLCNVNDDGITPCAESTALRTVVD
nr:mitochondrial amidoxime reducing component 2 [Quercus suber]